MAKFFRNISFLMLVLLFSGSGFGDLRPDFRDVRWGMSKITVMALEESVPEPVPGPLLSYRLTLLDIPAYLRYQFVENRLVEARYVLPVTDAKDLNRLRMLLQAKYGAPEGGEAAKGFPYTWETGRSRIVFSLDAEHVARILYEGKAAARFRREMAEASARRLEEELLRMF